MIKLLDDLLIAATCNPNVPGAIVAGLRQALDEARGTASTFAFTGILPTLSREQAKEMVEAAGGKVTERVSVRTDYVAAGKEPGARLEKAVELGVPVIDETSLLRMIGRPKEARDLTGNPAGTPGAKVDLSRLGTRENAASRALSQALGVPHAQLFGQVPQEAEPATVRVSHMGSADLPPPFDSMEEAQRAAVIVPTPRPADGPYRVCVKEIATSARTIKIGEVYPGSPDRARHHDCWLPCDKDGWIDRTKHPTPALLVRHELSEGGFRWRPLPPKSSALDEMAEQVARWAAPTREEVAKSHAEMWAHLTAAVPVEPADTEPTNPKDAAATGRVPLGLLSPIAKAHWALAQHCGRAKYGAWNWREAGARASIYLDAIDRHKDGYLSGETYDPKDGTHHLGNIMACCAILLEAEAAGKLVDDRPPHLDMRSTYADVEKRLAELTAKYAHLNPKHWAR